MKVSPLTRAFAIGAAAGLRSMTAPAATLGAGGNLWAGPAAVAAAGEIVVDKLPIAPSRLIPPALAVRLLAGAFCARALARRNGSAVAGAMLAGAVGALAGSFGGYHARRALAATARVPDVPIALVEDALAVSVAWLAARRA